MTREKAKEVTLEILDRWASMRPVPIHPLSNISTSPRFVALQYRQPQPPPAPQGTGVMFKTRLEAIKYARSKWDQDYAVFYLHPTGSIDVTPGVVRA